MSSYVFTIILPSGSSGDGGSVCVGEGLSFSYFNLAHFVKKGNTWLWWESTVLPTNTACGSGASIFLCQANWFLYILRTQLRLPPDKARQLPLRVPCFLGIGPKS